MTIGEIPRQLRYSRHSLQQGVRGARPAVGAPAPGTPSWAMRLVVVLLLGSYLLFAHGCHGDEDTDLLVLFPPSAAAEPQPPQGFTALFNGKDLSGWHGRAHFDPYKLAKMPESERTTLMQKWTEDARKHWTVENGELVNDGRGAYLTTDQEFGDIELLIEYKTVAKADSGIYLRGTPQVQIWDYTKEGGKWERGADKGSGGLFNNSKGAPGRDPLVLADKPFGDWNRFRILQVGERTTVYLNDKLVVDHARLENFWNRKLPLLAKGPIQLQTHGGEIRWRNIHVRAIPPDEANAILRRHSSAGFADVFNGKDFTGWDGPVANYEIQDGAIVCKTKKGGTIYTTEQYADFVARLEYKVPPGGNNGLAIRYPGKGQASTMAMCEIQILDDDAPRYAKLDPRQFNGSAYGMAAAHRGYQRPAGTWNLMEVTARGPTLKVELNGTLILDTDLSKITEFKDGKPHPGKDRAEGHFGFCGHNDPVAFRNVQIKRLESK
jgi:3-keto-disaccharide hydrolase